MKLRHCLLAFALLLGGALPPTAAVPAAAQQGDLPFFPETGFRIATPAFADYFAKRGGLRDHHGHRASGDRRRPVPARAPGAVLRGAGA